MPASNGRPQSRHPIRVVARRTGLKADLIRAWERRYGAIEPERSAGRHRFYSDSDIARLILLRKATSSGRTIGQVAHLDDAQLRELVEEDQRAVELPPRSPESAAELDTFERLNEQLGAPPMRHSGPMAIGDIASTDDSPAAPDLTTEAAFESMLAAAEDLGGNHLEDYLEPISRLDGHGLRQRLERAAVDVGYSRVLSEVIAPLAKLTIELTHQNHLREMHGNLAGFEIRAFIDGLIRRTPADPRAPSILVATPRGQLRELDALMVAATASFEGWDVTYLGSSLPTSDLVAAAHTRKVLAVSLAISGPADDPMLGPALLETRRCLERHIPLLVGGPAVHGYAHFLRPEAGNTAPAVHVHNLGELRNVLTQLRSRAATPGSGQGESAALPTIERPLVRRGLALPDPPYERPLGHREFPIARKAAELFELEPALITDNGCLRLGSLQSIRRLVHRLNQAPRIRRSPEKELRAGRLNAAALIHEAMAEVFRRYRRTRNPGVLTRAIATLRQELGAERTEAFFDRFDSLFPTSLSSWSHSARATGPRRSEPVDPESALERLILLRTLDRNPATAALRQLFGDRELLAEPDYPRVMAVLEDFFRRQPIPGDTGSHLLDQLTAPADSAPDSLSEQIERILQLHTELPRQLIDRLWVGLDVIREEEAPPWREDAPPPPSEIIDFEWVDGDPRRRNEPAWMRNLVLLAKNAKVWLRQLSNHYGKRIERLDQIPDESLRRIADMGFTGLWLIGIWKRSQGSQKIKRMAGRSEALASAYAVDDYVIDEELGGEEAKNTLEKRASRLGLRLACDMVPNHMGIDSKWLIERPERFVSVEERPFPSYSFTGEDLSPDPRVSIYLEDHYLDQSDAAVVFQRIDRTTGDVRFVYHGNDGTSLPWNDTAQLDYSRADVREAVIELIVRSSQRFPILRLDAAMTLIKEHFQRLWFPEPGKGGAVPSRAEHHMSREQLDRLMPEEFWRQVLARVAAESPGALLIAEGFWYMESYFIRELGMHRVYNSAFMHMLRDGDNAKFRSGLVSSLEYDPTVLECLVNFLTNPDEKTAVEQFGKGDRYFALCTLLVTLPGLPLFGHGQVAGLTEQYGMDYAAPLYSEDPDSQFIARHRQQIFPLLAERGHYASGRTFRLFDLRNHGDRGDGSASVAEDVIAFTNRRPQDEAAPEASERASDSGYRLVLVHNAGSDVEGRIHRSTRYRDSADGNLETTELLTELGLESEIERIADKERAGGELGGFALLFEDRISGECFVHPLADVIERGPKLRLGPWKSRVFAGFRLVEDPEGRYRRLAERLDGEGTDDLEAALTGLDRSDSGEAP